MLPFVSHLKKLVLVKKQLVRRRRNSTLLYDIYSAWNNFNHCLPLPLIVVTDDLASQPPHTPGFFTYDRYQRPLNLPFYDRPFWPRKDSGEIFTKTSTGNVITLNHIVTPLNDPPDMGLYGTVISVEWQTRMDLTHFASYTLHGANVNVLYLQESLISAECFHEIVQATPNLQELRLYMPYHFLRTQELCEYLVPLPEYCKKLRGLDINVLYSQGDLDFVWHTLFKMKCLEYLAIGLWAFLPSENEHETVCGDIIKYIKSMIQLRALAIIPRSLLSHQSLQLDFIVECLASLILYFPSLCHLDIPSVWYSDHRISNIDKAIKDCPKLKHLDLNDVTLNTVTDPVSQ